MYIFLKQKIVYFKVCFNFLIYFNYYFKFNKKIRNKSYLNSINN